MSKLKLIISREYLSEVRKKTFLVITLFMPFLIVGLIGSIFLFNKINTTNIKIEVIDENHFFEQKLVSSSNLFIHAKTDFSENIEEEIEQLKLQKDSIDGLLYIPLSKDSLYSDIENSITLYSNKTLPESAIYRLKENIRETIVESRKKYFNFDDKKLDYLNPRIAFLNKNITTNITERNTSIKKVFSFILLYVLMTFIVMNGVKIMKSVLEEKNNRVVEIIVSSVKPFQLMAGKIIGTGMVALTQFGIWIVFGVLVASLLSYLGLFAVDVDTVVAQGISIQQQTSIQQFSIQNQDLISSITNIDFTFILLSFILFFILGYLFYSSMFAAIGSAVDSETETQQFSYLAIVPLLIAFYGCISIMDNPQGPVALWLSFIPFTSPLAMVTRSIYGVDTWEWILSLTILALSCWFMVSLSARIYRQGILSYGNKTTLKTFWKYLKG